MTSGYLLPHEPKFHQKKKKKIVQIVSETNKEHLLQTQDAFAYAPAYLRIVFS